MFSSQEIGSGPASGSVSLQMFFQALQSEILRLKFYLLPTYPNAHAKVKNGFATLNSQKICSIQVSLELIFQALEPALFRLKFNSLSSKIVKFPEFNLTVFQIPSNAGIQPKYKSNHADRI